MRKIKKTLKDWCIENDKQYLLDEWDYEINTVKPEEITYGSNYKAFWICSKEHLYQAMIKERAKGSGCPFCAKQKLLRGFNDFKTWCTNNNKEHLLKEWDYEKNEKRPEQFLSGSNNSVYWVCNKRHSYKASIYKRRIGRGCPVCSNRIIIPSVNSFSVWCKENNKEVLLNEWDYEKNEKGPECYSSGSGYEAYWICSKGHSFHQAIVTRKGGSGCPYCAGQKVLPGFNDLATTHPYLINEWDYEKNEKGPESYSYGSEQKVHWVCSWCKKKWEAPINWRARLHTGCPDCAKQSTSFSEQVIFYYLSKVFPDVVNRDIDSSYEFDVFVPSIKTAIEYDGLRWHKSERVQKKDSEKDEFCRRNGIRLISFRDPKLPKVKESEVIVCVDGKDSELEKGIKKLFDLLHIKTDFSINIEKDTINIISLYQNNKKEKSIAAMYPELVKEWHPTKNGTLTPDRVSFGYGKKVWWLCPKCKHEYQASPNKRTYGAVGKITGCPKCGRKTIIKHNMNKVQNIETGEVFNSMSEAAAAYGTTIERIYKCCNKESYTVVGFHWRYLNPENRRKKTIKARIRNLDTGKIFENSREAALSVEGDNRKINEVCNGKTKKYKGFRWEYVID